MNIFPDLKNVIDLQGYNGVVSDEYNEKDYEYVGGTVNLPFAVKNFFDKKIVYQQTEVSPVSCTVHGSIGAISDLTGYVFTLDERKKLWNDALAKGADPKVGWSISAAVDLVRRYWLARHPDEPLMTFRILMASEDFFAALEKGYSLVCGFNGNAAYNSDRRDGTLDGVSFGRPTYGHCIRVAKAKDDKMFTVVVDNYPKFSNPNVYKISKDHLVQLWKNGVFMQSTYVFVSKKAYENMNGFPEVPLWAQGAVDRAKKAGVINDQTDLMQEIGGAALENILFDSKILTTKEGKVSLLRLLVVLDRIGVFNVK